MDSVVISKCVDICVGCKFSYDNCCCKQQGKASQGLAIDKSDQYKYQQEKVQLITYTSQLQGEIAHQGRMAVAYTKKIEQLEAKVRKLQALILLVDPAVADVEVGSTQITQWSEFTKCFPEEKGV